MNNFEIRKGDFMKRFFSICIIVIMLAGFAEAGAATEGNLQITLPLVTLDFYSLEELLFAHEAVRDGAAGEELMDLAEQTNFAELEEIFFPTAIPEPYLLYRISVHRAWVSMEYLQKDHFGTEETIRSVMQQLLHFTFVMDRMDVENPMASLLDQFNVTERDLINGIYLFRQPQTFWWGAERTTMSLQVPLHEMSQNPADMVRMLEVAVVCVETGEMTPYSPPVLTAPLCQCAKRWYNRMPGWLHWIFRWVFFGWIWMCC